MAQSRSAACDLLSGEAGSKEEKREEQRGGGNLRLRKGGEELQERCEAWRQLSLSYISVNICSTSKIRSFRIVIYGNVEDFKVDINYILYK